MFVNEMRHPFFREMARMNRDFGRLFNNMESNAPARQRTPVNVWMQDDNVFVEMIMPGVNEDDLDISLEGKRLTVRGERSVALPEGVRVIRHERLDGRFERQIQLPYRVEAEGVKALLENGVLTVTLPRAEADKPRQIMVKQREVAIGEG